MSMFNDMERTKKGNTEISLQFFEEVTAFETQFKSGYWCLLGPASENSWWNGKSKEHQGQWDSIALPMVDEVHLFKCHSSYPILPATGLLFA